MPGQSPNLHDASWSPWACAGAGLLAVLAGVRRLVAHLPRRAAGALLLPGSGRDGRLVLAVDAPAGVAASVFAETPGVRSAHARTTQERGTTVITIAATVEPHADPASPRPPTPSPPICGPCWNATTSPPAAR